MESDSLNLLVEINLREYIFSVVKKSEDGQNFTVIEKVVHSHNIIEKNKIINISLAQEETKKNIQMIESKLNHVFKDVILILDGFKFSSTNISGSKKLNNSQVLKENISYILNSLKSVIVKTEVQKTILHIFNSKSVLDGNEIETLPIGLFGDFYNHELTFLLIQNEDLKNVKQIFRKNNLNVQKIFIKSFVEGTQLIEQNNNSENFFQLKIHQDNSSIIFFDHSSLKYIEHFDFGTNIIFQDIKKICSIDNKIIKSFLENFNNEKDEDNEFLSKRYFSDETYKKIKKKLIFDIAKARIDELVKIMINDNINISSFLKNDAKIYLNVSEKLIFNNFKDDFISFLSEKNDFKIRSFDNFSNDTTIISAAHLSFFGWKKEAIPVTQIKNSLITRIFKSLFG